MPLKPESVTAWVDSREQQPFDLSPLAMETATLPTGDYCLAAAPEVAIIERKTASDLLGCIGRDRERFEAELGRIRAFPARIVICECSWDDLLHDPRSKLTSTSITGSIAAWSARYCGFQFCGTRTAAEDFAKRFLLCQARRLWERAEAFRREVAN